MMTKAELHSQLAAALRVVLDAEVGLAPLRPFCVTWTDEDFGQRSLVVIARSADAAREIVENATGHFALEVRSL